MLLPSASTSPEVGRNKPAIMLKSVDLPQPLGPIRLISRPSGIVRDTESSARTARPSRLNIFETVRTSSLAAVVAPAGSVHRRTAPHSGDLSMLTAKIRSDRFFQPMAVERAFAAQMRAFDF
jgi:hypothetical protein